MDSFNLGKFELPDYMLQAFNEWTAKLSVDCITHYKECFCEYLKLKDEGCKNKQQILKAKEKGLAAFRAKVDAVAIQIKSNNDFVKMAKNALDLKEKNQTFEVIQIFENAIDRNADELKKDPEQGFSWWPTKTQMAIIIAPGVAVGLGLGVLFYSAGIAGNAAICAGIAGNAAICAGIAGNAAICTAICAGMVGAGIVIILTVGGFAVYKYFKKKEHRIENFYENYEMKQYNANKKQFKIVNLKEIETSDCFCFSHALVAA